MNEELKIYCTKILLKLNFRTILITRIHDCSCYIFLFKNTAISAVMASNSTVAPLVTGVSPKEGPPGTTIVVRGENLGRNEDDIINLTINGHDCLPYLIWESPKKIQVRCMKIGSGPIIIETKSGCKGSCNVQFSCLKQTVSLTDESAIWVDEVESISFDQENKISVPRVKKDLVRDITSTAFMPELYIKTKYFDATLDQLEKELETLKIINNETRDKHKAPITDDSQGATLIKDHLVVVMECIRVLETLSKNVPTLRSHFVDSIEQSVLECLENAHELFDPLLEKKDLIQAVENAMEVFHQNEMLFNLPSEIDKSIQTGQFDTVVKNVDEVRFKSSASKHGLSDKIWSLIDEKIEQLKTTIELKLEESCRNISGQHNIDDIKRLVGYLVKIQPNSKTLSDYVWTAMSNMSHSLVAILDQIYEQCLTKSSDKGEIVQLVQRAITIFNTTYYDIHQLGQSFFDPKDDFSTKASSDEMNFKMVEFDRTMISNPIIHLCMLLRAALLPSTKESLSSDLMPHESQYTIAYLETILQLTVSCHVRLTKTNLPPSAKLAVEDFRELVFDLRKKSTIILLNNAAQDIKNLYKNEDWIVDVDDVFGGKTNLPSLFERKVLDALRFANDAIFQTSLAGEKSILKRIEVQAKVKELVQKLINSFLEALDNTLTESTGLPIESLIASRNSNRSHFEYDKLLIIICNCQYTKEQSLLKLKEEFEKLQDLKLDKVFEICRDKYNDFIDRNSVKFCKIKAHELGKPIRDAKKSKDSRKVAAATLELQMNLVIVNAQIFMIAPQLVERLMSSTITELTL